MINSNDEVQTQHHISIQMDYAWDLSSYPPHFFMWDTLKNPAELNWFHHIPTAYIDYQWET